MQESISIGPLVLYIGSFIATLAVKKVNKLIGEKVLAKYYQYYFINLDDVDSSCLLK